MMEYDIGNPNQSNNMSLENGNSNGHSISKIIILIGN